MRKVWGVLVLGLLLLGVARIQAAKSGPVETAETMMKKSDCFTCHQVGKALVGPAFKDIAKKYKGDPKAPDLLVQKIKLGGAGNWGEVPMAAHPGLKNKDVKAMVHWVLAR